VVAKKKKQTIGDVVKARRAEMGLSSPELARLSGVGQSTIIRIESGFIANPAPDKLRRIAEALDLSTAELFALGEYTMPSDLPVFTPYMRAKYHDLTPEDVAEIAAYAAKIAKRRGVSLTGPKPGEDE
jgi:transcriptional regulator with XRE-family HTH domain